MAWTFSKRSIFYECPKTYHARYVLKKRTPPGDPQLIGIAADELLEAIVAGRLNGTIQKPSEIVDFMRPLIDDMEDADGVITSHKQSAAWIIEYGLPQLTAVLKALKGADEVVTQAQLYFDVDWQPTEQRPGEHIGVFKNRSVYGGDLDIMSLHGDTARVWDWKSGKSRYSKPAQIAEYQALISKRWPKVKHIEGALVWLAENKTEPCREMDRKGAAAVRARIEREAAEIAAATTFECAGCWVCNR